MRSSSDCVAARLEPTGSRVVIWMRDSSSSGVKFTPDILNNGYSDEITMRQAVTMTQRCASENSSRRV